MLEFKKDCSSLSGGLLRGGRMVKVSLCGRSSLLRWEEPHTPGAHLLEEERQRSSSLDIHLWEGVRG